MTITETSPVITTETADGAPEWTLLTPTDQIIAVTTGWLTEGLRFAIPSEHEQRWVANGIGNEDAVRMYDFGRTNMAGGDTFLMTLSEWKVGE